MNAMMFQGMHPQEWGMGWLMGWNWIFGLIMLIIIVWLIIRISNISGSSSQSRSDTALDILKERYARGEIDKQEYEERKKVLQSP